MSEVDEIEQAAAIAEAETGARGGGAKIRLCLKDEAPKKASYWTEDEREYVRANHGRISEAKIGAHLGRTEISVHLQVTRELHLTAPSKDPSILTAEQISWGVGVDSKTIHALMDSGRMPHRLLPGRDKTRVIDRHALMRWLLDPLNWAYVKPERVGGMRPRGKRKISDCYDYAFWESARKVVLKAKAEWKDEWLTPMQAAEAIGKERKRGAAHNINKAIHEGNLKATRWGNWKILRSALPPADMTFNVAGRIMPKNKIYRVNCGKCGGAGHNKRSCAGSKVR